MENHALIWGIHSGCLDIWLHWNNGISIDDLNVDDTRTASMFVNLKIKKGNHHIQFNKHNDNLQNKMDE